MWWIDATPYWDFNVQTVFKMYCTDEQKVKYYSVINVQKMLIELVLNRFTSFTHYFLKGLNPLAVNPTK